MYGRRHAALHLWATAAYPNPAITYANPPTAVELQNALGTIVITNPTLVTPTLNPTYLPGPAVTMLSATGVQKVYVSGSGINTVNRFTVTGITFTVPGACSNVVNIKADIWSSNSNSDNGVQCFDAGKPFVANDPILTGTLLCTNPRQFVVNISSVNTSSQQATYIVYADQAPLGTLDASDPVVYTSGSVTIPAAGGGFYTSGPVPFSNTYANKNLWVRVQVTGATFSTTGLLTNTCALLPVQFKSFTARRENSSTASLQWETGSEQNNKGFEVQRRQGSGDFQTIAFVGSSAKDGNSSSALSYQYKDGANTGLQTQYRLAQVDLDGRQSFSHIVIVQGSDVTGMTALVYPNPSPNGNVSVVFNNSDKKSLLLTDSNGKTIQTKSNVNISQYNITGLKSGIYFLKIFQQSNGATLTEKIVVR